MREIKFRAWDILHNSMIENPSLSYRDGVFSLRQKGPSTLLDCNFVLEQFAGIRDKNDREIYEGDIVRGIAGWFIDEQIGVVVYAGMTFAIKNDNGWFFNSTNHYLKEIDGIEVIGNIHENPELLEAVNAD